MPQSFTLPHNPEMPELTDDMILDIQRQAYVTDALAPPYPVIKAIYNATRKVLTDDEVNARHA